MKSQLRTTDDHGVIYNTLAFCCPGCIESDGNSGLHILPVNTEGKKSPSWDWDGNLEAPTLTPSILTRTGKDRERVCHSFLRAGVFEFLGDCTHSLAGQNVPMPDLPEWFTDR